MNETEKMMAKKKLQDFIDNKNTATVNTSRSKQNSNTLKAGGIRKRGFGAAIANKNRYAPSGQDNSSAYRRQQTSTIIAANTSAADESAVVNESMASLGDNDTSDIIERV